MMTRPLVPHFILEKFSRQKFSGHLQAVSLFIDTSGFTRITEALMQHGPEGAEILAQALQAVFHPLIRQVYRYGGFVANFSGDGFTALFPGQSAETGRRALAAAWHSCQYMAHRGPYQTRHGRFTFTVKASLARGRVDWGILPETTQAETHIYYFRGQAIDRAIGQEQAIAGGQVGLHANLYRLVAPVVSAQAQADLFQVAALTGPLPDPAILPAGRTVEQHQTTFFSPLLHRLTVQGEFRQVLTMFINVGLADQNDPLPDFMTACLPLLNQYGGYLARIGRIGGQDAGYTLLLFWGAPHSHENNIERALNFALALQATASAPLRIGVTHHTVYAGFVGSSLRQEYTCYGLSVNQAARQMVAANWGEIWLDQTTANRAQNPVRPDESRFQVRLAGRFAFKGISHSLPIYVLTGRQIRLAAARPENMLVGRAEELARLSQWLEPIFRNQFGGIIGLVGEAGIGKSRLLYELKQQLVLDSKKNDRLAERAEAQVAWFHCPATESGRRPLYPFRYFLQRYFGQDQPNQTVAQKKERFRHRLADLIARTPEPALQRALKQGEPFLGALLDLHWPASLYEQVEPQLRLANSMDALKNLFVAESNIRPVVIELEDAHWLDDESVQLVRYLTITGGDQPLAIVAASRRPLPNHWLDEPPLAARTMQLTPLTTNQVQQLAETYLAAPVSFALAQLVTDRTNGNPFFAEQLLRYLQEEQLLASGETGLVPTITNGRIPTDIRTLLVAHLDRLGPEVKDVVQKAAVLGQAFDLPVLALMCSSPAEVAPMVEAATQAAIWTARNGSQYLFRHALMRDTAYDMQLRTRLRALHRLAGQALEQTFAANLAPHYDDLAHHYRQAEDAAKERRYAYLAGQLAAAQFANAQAEAYFSRALVLTPPTDLANRYKIYLGREAVYNLQGQREAQQQDLLALEALAGQLADRAKQAEVALRWANYAGAIDDYPTAAEKAQRAITLAEGQLLSLEAEGYFRWGVTLYNQNQNEAAHPRLAQALTLTRKAGLSGLEAQTLNTFGGIAFNQSDYLAAKAFFEQALAIANRTGNKSIACDLNHNLGLVFKNQGDYAAAKTYYNASLYLAREVGSRRNEVKVLQSLGVLLKEEGNYAEAITHYKRALPLSRHIGNRWAEAALLSSLGTVYRLQGQLEQAQIHQLQSRDIFNEIGDRKNEAIVLQNLGVLAASQGMYDQAGSYLRQTLEIYQILGFKNGQGMARLNLGVVHLLQGDYGVAQNYFENTLAIQQAIGNGAGQLHALSQLTLVHHLQDDPETALDYGQQALEMARDMGHRQLEADTLTSTGHAFLSLKNYGQAISNFKDALSLYQDIKVPLKRLEPLAGLAKAYREQRQPAEAMVFVEQILDHAQTGQLDQTEAPCPIYLTCYQVLKDNHDPRAAEVLAAAYRQLQARVALINDEHLRHSFLANIAAHHEIVREWHRMRQPEFSRDRDRQRTRSTL